VVVTIRLRMRQRAVSELIGKFEFLGGIDRQDEYFGIERPEFVGVEDPG